MNSRRDLDSEDRKSAEISNELIDQLKSEKDNLEEKISNLDQEIEQYNQIKNSRRDEWQNTLINSENLKSRSSTLKDVEGYDNPANWTEIFSKRFYLSLIHI